jgi:RNA polymerase sigma-70 factor (ECF subfamily)
MVAEEKALLVPGLDDFGRGEMKEAAGAQAVVCAREADLIARLQAGEISAFEELFAEFEPLVYALTRRIIGHEEDARDATQETFLKVYRHFARFRGEASLKTWICRIAINQAHSTERWWRRRRRTETISLDEPLSGADQAQPVRELVPSPASTPEAEALARERRQQLEQALGRVKQDFRTAVILRDIEGLAYEEIGYILEISLGTVKSRIARGREMLRAQLRALESRLFDDCDD